MDEPLSTSSYQRTTSARIERKARDKGFPPWTLARAEKLKAKLLAGETSTERPEQLAVMKAQAIADEHSLPLLLTRPVLISLSGTM